MQYQVTMKIWTWEPYPNTEYLRHTDLRSEAKDESEAGSITICPDANSNPYSQKAEYLYVDNRLGIAWGGDASWADASSVEEGIEMWVNNSDEWEARN